VQFTAEKYAVGEYEGSKVITATLSHATAMTVQVKYEIYDPCGCGVTDTLLESILAEINIAAMPSANKSASEGKDGITTSGMLKFAPGETSKTFSVPILQDEYEEGDEDLKLRLLDPANATLGEIDRATLTIEDDDVTAPPRPTTPPARSRPRSMSSAA